MDYPTIWLLLLLPLPLLAIAWIRAKTSQIMLTVLTVSAFLLVSGGARGLKLVLLGEDYSSRLFITIELNLLLTIIAGFYLAIKHKWIAAVAAITLALGWLYMGAINSVV